MSRVREVPLHLTRLEARELGRALQATDKLIADALAALALPQLTAQPRWADRDALELRQLRIRAILDKLERTIGVPLSELGL